MDATTRDAAMLIELQQIDLALIKARKNLDELPQKQLIADLRKKRIAVKDKQIEIQTMNDESSARMASLAEEDDRLAAKQAASQAIIERSLGDYRTVDAHSKELEACARLRDEITASQMEEEKKLDSIAKLLRQISDALAAIDSQEQAAIASYKEEGGALLRTIQELERRRGACAGELPEPLLATYERIAKGKCGVAVATLSDRSCNACRNPIDESRLLQIRRQAPLSACPHCGRLLVIPEAR